MEAARGGKKTVMASRPSPAGLESLRILCTARWIYEQSRNVKIDN